MYVPRTRETVFIDGEDGVYVVAWVDQALQIADLIRVDIATRLCERACPSLCWHRTARSFPLNRSREISLPA
jgi:hypothetical protein